MSDVREAMNRISAQVLSSPENAAKLDVTCKFIVSGTGEWLIRCRPPVSVQVDHEIDATENVDCIIDIEGSVLLDIVHGVLNPQVGFLEGQFSLLGDLEQALKLILLLSPGENISVMH
jgi:hypothetical protein